MSASQIRITLSVIALFVAWILFADWTATYLWFETLGYSEIFWRLRLVKLGAFTCGLLAAFAYFWTNLRILSTNLDVRVLVTTVQAGRRSTVPPTSFYHGAVATLSLVLALIFALVLMGKWDVLVRYFWAQEFGTADPIFARDIGYYLFVLPCLELLQNGLTNAFFLMAAGLIWAYMASGEIRIAATGGLRMKAAVRWHLAVNLALFLFAFACGYYLDRFGLLQATRGAVHGAGFTDVKVTIPALWFVTAATLIFAAAVLVPRVLSQLRLAGAIIAGMFVLLVVGLWIVPATVQSVWVEPNELEVETPYLRHNIAFTRRAFGLDAIEERSHGALDVLTPAVVADNRETIDNIRLWDWRPLESTFRQLQQMRTYYTFNDVDVDRYYIEGDYRQVMVSARELADELPEKLQTWLNRHLQYTHGHGLAMSFAADKDARGAPVLVVKDLPPQTHAGLSVPQPAIYYGEAMSGHRIVSTGVKEFDYPRGDDNVYSHYRGHGGVLLDSLWKRWLFAWYEFDFNIVLTSYITPQSRLQMWRPVRERVHKLAPFLRLDEDPYLVLGERGLHWVVDAYTVSSWFPYAEPYDKQFNFIRNSVKVTIDAYNGDVRFYVIDAQDPVLRVYRKAFATLFQPVERMPEDLRSHLRYPIDLFRAQLEMYGTYHMTVPQVFYNAEDLWVVPREKYGGEPIRMEPYYVLMKLPHEDRLQFLIMLPLTPNNRDNMVAWMAGRCDYPGYGELIVYKLPKDHLSLGPIQVEAMIDQDPLISEQLTLWDQRGSRVIRGNILVIPMGDAFIYVEPVYLIAEGTSIPQLKRVIVSDGAAMAMEPTLAGALQVVFEGRPSSPARLRQETAVGELPARDALERAEQALRRGDWDAFGNAMQQLKEMLSN